MGSRTTAAPAAPTEGWFDYGKAQREAQWDGHAWTGSSRTAVDVAPSPKWHHRPLAFLGHAWLWWMVVGWALFAAGSYVVGVTDKPALAFLTLPGSVIFMAGVYFLVDPHERFGQLPRTGRLVVWGVVAGLVASMIAHPLEEFLGRHLPFETLLWLAGPIEESSKLFVPVLLLILGGAAFRDPRAGLLLVLLSGIAFGAFEQTFYVGLGGQWQALENGISRPLVELMHPFLTAFAAGVIWLAAWRRKSVLTWAGLVAYFIAMAVHSVHDGLPPMLDHTTGQSNDVPVAQMDTAISAAVSSLPSSLIVAIITFLMLRHSARELVPPDAVADNAPHWRPALRQWGVPKEQRDATAKTPEDAATTPSRTSV